MANPSFIFGGDTGITYDDLQRRRKVLDALAARSSAPQNIGEGLNALGEGILGGIEERRLRTAKEKYDTAAATDYSAATSALSAPYTMASAGASSASGTALAAAAPGATTGGTVADLPSGDIYTGFIDTVRQGDQSKGLAGITNPYGLAAVAATGKRESGFSPGNVYRQWSDPSQSGQAGTAGGIMSWRAERLGAMRDFVAKNGGDPNRPSPQLQAQFFLSEDPGLVQRLNAAKSPEEAQELMNGAWKFAGYDDPNNPERNARIQTARSYAGQFAGQQQPVQMAAADPAAGNATPTMTDATSSGVPVPTSRDSIVQAMAAQPQQQAAPSPAVQRVAQAMPQPPQMGIPPEALRVLQNPAATPQQKAVVQALVEQRQAQAQAQYEQQMKLYQTQEQRAYETGVRQDERQYQTGVRQEGYQREDSRNQYLDARQGSRDARSDLQYDQDYGLRVQQANKPNIISVFDQETGRERKGYMDQNGQFVPVGGVEAPKKGNGVVVRGPDGSLIQVGGDTPALTEGQSKDAVYSTRAKGSLGTLDQYAPALMDRTDRMREAVPFGLARGGQNTEYQLAKQAGNEFLQAILRKDTGAAITGEEESLYGVTYLPQPGDSPELLAQKQQSRARAVAAIEAGMPPAAMVAQEIALRKSAQPSQGQPAEAGADGWQTLPNGVKIREKR
jgi:hypothetical protein